MPILGHRAPTALGRPFRDLWSGIWDDISPLVEATLAGQSQSVVDMRLDLSRANVPEESYWSFSYSPAFDDAGRIAGLFCVTGETTARVLAERARAAADERLEFALSAGNGIGVWDWDVLNDRVTADARFAGLYGVEPELARAGAPINAFFAGIHPDDRARVEAEIGSAMADLSAFVSEYRLLRADGTIRWVSAQGRCIPGARRPLRALSRCQLRHHRPQGSGAAAPRRQGGARVPHRTDRPPPCADRTGSDPAPVGRGARPPARGQPGRVLPGGAG